MDKNVISLINYPKQISYAYNKMYKQKTQLHSLIDIQLYHNFSLKQIVILFSLYFSPFLFVSLNALLSICENT